MIPTVKALFNALIFCRFKEYFFVALAIPSSMTIRSLSRWNENEFKEMMIEEMYDMDNQWKITLNTSY